MIIRTVITIALSLVAVYYTMRHNMHMFQLNGYKNDEHIRWIKKNIKSQWLLGFGLVIGIFRMFFPVIGLDIVIWITLLLDLLVYKTYKCMNTKKKLVYTARVKRMIFTVFVVWAVVFAVAAIFTGLEIVSALGIICVSSMWYMNIVANIINHPVEKLIGNFYINDAKRILTEREDLTVIGVTGSFGKTSVKYYLETLLNSKYSVLVTPGNFNTPFGVTKTVREYLKPTHEIFICEMGARRVGEIKELCEIAHPKYGIITAVGPQHLETFGSVDNIKNTKFELADSIPSDGFVFLNGDNELICEKATEYSNKVMYSTEKKDGYYADEISVGTMGTEFVVHSPSGESEHFTMQLIGGHNVINVVGAIAVANKLGISLKDLRVPVRRIKPVEHRMEMKRHGDVTIIDDAYNSNPVGSKAAVETLRMFEGIRILITPGMVELGDKEEEYNYKFGTYASKCCDYILLVGKKHTEPIYKGVLSEGFPEDRLQVFENLNDAVSYAYAIKGQGQKYILLENDLPDNY